MLREKENKNMLFCSLKLRSYPFIEAPCILMLLLLYDQFIILQYTYCYFFQVIIWQQKNLLLYKETSTFFLIIFAIIFFLQDIQSSTARSLHRIQTHIDKPIRTLLFMHSAAQRNNKYIFRVFGRIPIQIEVLLPYC